MQMEIKNHVYLLCRKKNVIFLSFVCWVYSWICLFCRFETQHGVLCAIGFVTADCVSKTPIVSWLMSLSPYQKVFPINIFFCVCVFIVFLSSDRKIQDLRSKFLLHKITFVSWVFILEECQHIPSVFYYSMESLFSCFIIIFLLRLDFLCIL